MSDDEFLSRLQGLAVFRCVSDDQAALRSGPAVVSASQRHTVAVRRRSQNPVCLTAPQSTTFLSASHITSVAGIS